MGLKKCKKQKRNNKQFEKSLYSLQLIRKINKIQNNQYFYLFNQNSNFKSNATPNVFYIYIFTH